MNKYFYPVLCLAIFSCNGTNQKNDQAVVVDSIEITPSIVETEDRNFNLDSNTVIAYENETIATTKEKLEKTFGKQWDFCDCIFKTDSIQSAIETAGDISDDEFDHLMNRFEEIDLHCKTLISSPNNTPEERKTHERKVKKCLKNSR